MITGKNLEIIYMTEIIRDISKWRDIRKNKIQNNKSIGLIMTMGNLHQGHVSLLQKSLRENNISILTICMYYRFS